MNEEIRKKIGKMLNMTVENGCSEDEQESAMRIAAGLAAKAGIDLDSCRPAGELKPKAKYKHVSEAYKPHQAFAAKAAAELYGVECYAYDLGAHGISFVGREENIELTEQTWFWLMRQVELLYKQHLPRGLSQSARAEFRKTFKAACAERVFVRAVNLVREMVFNDNVAQSSTGHNALVVKSHFEQLHSENREYWEEQNRPYIEREKQREEAESVRRERMRIENPQAYDRMIKEEERELKRASKLKGRRGRSIPRGNGTAIGREAGNSVQLRKELV